jgi:hypothetical protein
MSFANHYAQTSDGARYGAHRLVGDRVLQQAPGRSAQGRVHMHPVGSGCKSAAAALLGPVATGSSILINADDRTTIRRRRRGTVLPTGGRAASHTSRLALNYAAAVLPRGHVKPLRINSGLPQPLVDPSHFVQRLSSLASSEKQASERAHGTVLYLSGEFPKARGDHQHEFG